ncbi:MAG: hypothetical protein HUJ26_19065 [Planctomycetaceae bacterium]|nr:hypothetical protein [Planctomycetaceae bacterium]
MTEYKTGPDRNVHIHNICVALLEIYDEQQRFGVITSNGLLEYIAGKAEARAKTTHGDCLGGHGLCLNVYRRAVRGKTQRVFDLTEEVLQTCRDWLANEGEEPDVLI